MKTPMMGELGVIGMAAREQQRRQARRKASEAPFAGFYTAAVRWIIMPLIVFVASIIAACALGATWLLIVAK